MINNPLPAVTPDHFNRAVPIDPEEVDQVLAVLRTLKNQIASPAVKECLEAARFDIAQLATAGEMADDDDDEDYGDDEEDDEDDEEDDEDEED